MIRRLRLNRHGLLPPGVHDCDLDEIERMFARAGRSGRRRELFGKLRAYVHALRRTGWQACIIVDGSFVMGAVSEPNDIDVVLVLPGNWEVAANVRPFEYDLISPRRTRRLFEMEVFAVASLSRSEQDWVSFFQEVKPRWQNEFGIPVGVRKGIVRLTP